MLHDAFVVVHIVCGQQDYYKLKCTCKGDVDVKYLVNTSSTLNFLKDVLLFIMFVLPVCLFVLSLESTQKTKWNYGVRTFQFWEGNIRFKRKCHSLIIQAEESSFCT